MAGLSPITTPLLPLTALAKTANFTVDIPAGYQIVSGILRETANHAVTGGIRIGTSAAGVDVAVALAVGALALVDLVLLKRYFSATVVQTLNWEAVVGWNSASVNLSLLLARME